MIREHQAKDGAVTYGVRVYGGKDGQRRWVGTYATRQAAEEAERLATGRLRNCAKCSRRFRTKDDRRVRCPACIGFARPSERRDDFWVYRVYDEQGTMLYVGITSSGTKRFRRHGNNSEWWPKVASILIDHCESRDDACRLEREMIQRYDPPHNVDHRVKRVEATQRRRVCVDCRKVLDADADQTGWLEGADKADGRSTPIDVCPACALGVGHTAFIHNREREAAWNPTQENR